MDSQESELGGVETRPPLTFLSCVCSGGWLLSSGGPTPQPPPIFTLVCPVPDPVENVKAQEG